jgi:hypothetical protein
MKKLIVSQVPDIIARQIEASLSDRPLWCGLQGLGRSVEKQFRPFKISPKVQIHEKRL